MYERKNISFNSDGITLRGWFYKQKSESQRPCIILTHGFSALKEHYLDKFADKFANAGFNVMVYDNRNFGESDGEPRLEVNPSAQVSDIRNAITFAQTIPGVNPNKIGLWGTSFSGGNVIVTAARDKRVGCVVSQVPFISGHHKSLRLNRPEQWEHILANYNEERKRRMLNQPPTLIPVVTENPDKLGIMRQPDAYQFFKSVPKWPNQVTLRSVENSGDYEPIAYIKQINPTPLMFIVAKKDTVNTTDVALKAFNKAREPKKLVMIEGDHFAPYVDEFEICSNSACAWFSKNLLSNQLIEEITQQNAYEPLKAKL